LLDEADVDWRLWQLALNLKASPFEIYTEWPIDMIEDAMNALSANDKIKSVLQKRAEATK